MDLLSGYASSSGSEGEDEAAPAVAAAPTKKSSTEQAPWGKESATASVGRIHSNSNGAPAAAAAAAAPRKRKRRKLVLPAHIEAALASGAGLGSDEDSDGDEQRPFSRGGAASGGLSGLLSILPPPKKAKQMAPAGLGAGLAGSDSASTRVAVPKAPPRAAAPPPPPPMEPNGDKKEPSGGGSSSSSLSGVSKLAAMVPSGSSLGLVPNLVRPARQRLLPAAAPQNPSWAAAPTPTPAALGASSSVGSANYLHASAELASSAAAAAAAAVAATATQAYSNWTQQAPAAAAVGARPYPAGAAAAGGAANSGSSSSGGGGRRRGRDVERQLAAGNFEALGAEVAVKTVEQELPTYDALAAAPPPGTQTQEIKINASFYNPRAGTTEVVDKPTRLQKRKHQINQLAAQAASMELDALDSRGHARSQKSQAKAKYGW